MKHGVLDMQGCSVAWAVEQRTKHPGAACGDGYLLRRFGSVLLAAVTDGSGSGSCAAAAADQCLRSLSTAKTPDIHMMFAEAHQALERTRGAALGIALISLENLTLEWAAAGDINGVLIQQETRQQSMIQCGGTLGLSFSGVLPQQLPLEPSSTILLVSDGVASGYGEGLSATQSAEDCVRTTLTKHARNNDDAIALALKVGPAP